MTTATPTIHIISRNNYEEQFIVPLPNVLPLPEHHPSSSSIRVQTSVLSLTANNLTYGRIGHLIRTWEIYPLPPSIPFEYSDPQKFGRIPAWGYATVIESNVSGIEIGAQVFGILPIGTLPLDMEVQVNSQIPGTPGQFFEVSKHRENVMALYNQYLFYPPAAQPSFEQKQSQGYDALFQVSFTTSYLMNRFALPWDSTEFVHPRNGDDSWTAGKGALDDNTVVLVFADSGKTALALAYLLKNGRPAGKKPRTVVGIGSSASRGFVKATGLYDTLLTYNSDSTDLDAAIGLTSDTKIVICEFGSRGGAGDRWEKKLRQSHRNIVQLVVAGEVVQESPEKATERFLARSKNATSTFNTSDARIQAIGLLGEKKFLEELLIAWSNFKEQIPLIGVQLVWGTTIGDVADGWDRLCQGKIGADQGLVFSL